MSDKILTGLSFLLMWVILLAPTIAIVTFGIKCVLRLRKHQFSIWHQGLIILPGLIMIAIWIAGFTGNIESNIWPIACLILSMMAGTVFVVLWLVYNYATGKREHGAEMSRQTSESSESDQARQWIVSLIRLQAHLQPNSKQERIAYEKHLHHHRQHFAGCFPDWLQPFQPSRPWQIQIWEDRMEAIKQTCNFLWSNRRCFPAKWLTSTRWPRLLPWLNSLLLKIASSSTAPCWPENAR